MDMKRKSALTKEAVQRMSGAVTATGREMEVAVLIFTAGENVATVATDGTKTLSWMGDQMTLHSSLRKGVAFVAARGYKYADMETRRITV